MSKRKKKSILVSPIGTTDPIRSQHDGPMIHILRVSDPKPDAIFLIFTKGLQNSDIPNSWEINLKALEHYFNEWDYYPDLYAASLITDNPHILNEVFEPILEIIGDKSVKNFDQLFFNMTSGTPAIMTVIEMESLESAKNVGLMVSNPFIKEDNKNDLIKIDTTHDLEFLFKGSTFNLKVKEDKNTLRTNDVNYNIDEALESNLDDQIDLTNNRVSRSPLNYLDMKKKRERIEALLDHYDFNSIKNITDFSDEIKGLLEHLIQRINLNYEKAERVAKTLDLPFNLYPLNEKNEPIFEDSKRIAENYMLVRIFLETNSINEFVIRLDNLSLFIGLKILKKLIRELGFKDPEMFFTTDDEGKTYLNYDLLEKEIPDLIDTLKKEYLDLDLKKELLPNIILNNKKIKVVNLNILKKINSELYDSIVKKLNRDDFQEILIKVFEDDNETEYLNYNKLIDLLPDLEIELLLSCSVYNPKQYLGVITIVNLLKYFDEQGMLENYSIFNKIKSLNKLRNEAGHHLTELNRNDIKKVVGKRDLTFLNKLKELILHYFPEITDEYLDVYNTSIKYIRENLVTN